MKVASLLPYVLIGGAALVLYEMMKATPTSALAAAQTAAGKQPTAQPSLAGSTALGNLFPSISDMLQFSPYTIQPIAPGNLAPIDISGDLISTMPTFAF